MIRAGVIGVGYLGRFHAQKYKACESSLPVRLNCLFDLSPERVSEVSNELGTKGTSDFEVFLREVDIVTIASSSHSHSELAMRCLEAGKHINVEKPLAVSLQEAEKVVQFARSKNLKVAVGHSERLAPVYQELKKRKVRPQSATFTRLAPFGLRHADVSVALDLLVHDLDLAMDLFGSEPLKVQAQVGRQVSDTEDWIQVWLEFSEGRTCILECSRLHPFLKREARILTDLDQFHLNFQTQELITTSFLKTGELQTKKFEGGKADNLLTETQNFIKSCLGEEELIITGDHGLRAVKWAQKVRGL